jgi:Flp pilus assembly protein TadG
VKNKRKVSLRTGIATVEFALVAPLLMLLLAAVLDGAMVLRYATTAANAARIGAQYGSMSTSNAANTAGMQSAALNAATGMTGMTATAVRSCQCSGGSSISCTGSCTGGKMMIYVQVTTRVTAPSVFSYPGLSLSSGIAYTASMRAQ